MEEMKDDRVKRREVKVIEREGGGRKRMEEMKDDRV